MRNRYSNKAQYINNLEVKEYRGNPFIEALPRIYSEDEVLDLINEYPDYDESERLLPLEVRLQCIDKIYQCFQGLSFHLDIEYKIARIIREGYLHRNPIKPEFTKYLNLGYEAILSKDIDIYNINKIRRNTAYGFSIIGTSGMGKSSTVNKILSLYPQVIEHTKYDDIELNSHQITWLKLDCPFDGSIKGLCSNFFFEIDNLLGTKYYERYAGHRSSTNQMMPVIAQIAQKHGLGVLVIDEIQHLSVAKSGGIEKMLNFFVTLINMIGIPVILIGTPKAKIFLEKEFRQARRSSGQGSVDIKRLEKGEDWEMLLETIFNYQWTNKKFELTQELSDILYDKSLGIIDVAIKLYTAAQSKAIRNEEDIITPSLIESVYDEEYSLLKETLEDAKKKINKNKKKDEVKESEGIDLRKVVANNSNSNYESLKKEEIIKDDIL